MATTLYVQPLLEIKKLRQRIMSTKVANLWSCTWQLQTLSGKQARLGLFSVVFVKYLIWEN